MLASLAHYPDLAGRTVFVSGGGSGIGAAFVRAFAGQGARVAFIDIAEAPARALAAELGEDVRYWHCDVRDIAALQATIAEAGRSLGPVASRHVAASAHGTRRGNRHETVAAPL